MAGRGARRRRAVGGRGGPARGGPEGCLVEGLEVLPVDSLTALVNHLSGVRRLKPVPPLRLEMTTDPGGGDFREVRGQEHVKRALEVAAGGGRHAPVVGPPGAGKTLLA